MKKPKKRGPRRSTSGIGDTYVPDNFEHIWMRSTSLQQVADHYSRKVSWARNAACKARMDGMDLPSMKTLWSEAQNREAELKGETRHVHGHVAKARLPKPERLGPQCACGRARCAESHSRCVDCIIDGPPRQAQKRAA